MSHLLRAALLAGLVVPHALAIAAPVVFSAGSAVAAGIQPTVDAYRAALGTLNANVTGSFAGGRREINWDGVPDALAAPGNLPGSFFNTTSARGVEFTTPGTGFQVSANGGVAPIEFGNIDASYSSLFAPFSSQRLFTAIGSNIVDVRFFVPGSSTAALTNGFGAVFSDVDLTLTTSIEYFDALDVSLGLLHAPSVVGNETLSFVGALFTEGAVVSRVRITSGNQILAAGNAATDLVVMDDFIFGEPMSKSVPEPATAALATAALLAVWRLRRRRPRSA